MPRRRSDPLGYDYPTTFHNYDEPLQYEGETIVMRYEHDGKEHDINHGLVECPQCDTLFCQECGRQFVEVTPHPSMTEQCEALYHEDRRFTRTIAALLIVALGCAIGALVVLVLGL